jgi:hypothetical protein
VRECLGRPGASPNKLAAARRELAKGTGILKTARLTGLGTGTVQRLKRETALWAQGQRCLTRCVSTLGKVGAGQHYARRTRDAR